MDRDFWDEKEHQEGPFLKKNNPTGDSTTEEDHLSFYYKKRFVTVYKKLK